VRYWETTAFKALQKEWYAKLKDDGFCDAEIVCNGDLKLRQPTRLDHTDHETKKQAKLAYFNLMTECVERHKFDREDHRIIMTLHAEGKRIIDIIHILAIFGEERERQSIRYIIRRYEMRWGIREYTAKQLQRPEKK